MADYAIKNVIQEMLIEHGETQMNKYSLMLVHGISGLREMDLDVSGVPTIVALNIDANTDTVQLPGDYINYVKIGICGADGSVHALGLNASMCLPRSYDACGNPGHSQDSGAVVPVFYGSMDGYADNYRNGEFSGRMFGIGGGLNPNGYYRIDRERWTINLSDYPVGTDHIVLEYISSLKKVGENFMVHPFIVQALKDWMWWKSIVYNPNRSLGEKDMARNEYFNSRRLARKRFNAATQDEYLAALRSGNVAAPRF